MVASANAFASILSVRIRVEFTVVGRLILPSHWTFNLQTAVFHTMTNVRTCCFRGNWKCYLAQVSGHLTLQVPWNMPQATICENVTCNPQVLFSCLCLISLHLQWRNILLMSPEKCSKSYLEQCISSFRVTFFQWACRMHAHITTQISSELSSWKPSPGYSVIFYWLLPNYFYFVKPFSTISGITKTSDACLEMHPKTALYESDVSVF